MRNYLRKFLLQYIAFTPLHELRNKLGHFYQLYHGYNEPYLSEIDSLSPQIQQDYLDSEKYGSMLESNPYQIQDVNEELIHNSHIPANDFSGLSHNNNLISEPLEEEQMDSLTPEQEVQNAVDKVTMNSQDTYAECGIEESRLLSEQEILEDIVDDPSHEDILMDDNLESLLPDPFLDDPFYMGPML